MQIKSSLNKAMLNAKKTVKSSPPLFKLFKRVFNRFPFLRNIVKRLSGEESIKDKPRKFSELASVIIMESMSKSLVESKNESIIFLGVAHE